MPKTCFPYRLFVSLLLVGGLITFFTANTVSVTKHSDQKDMITPFPVVVQLENSLQVVTREQLTKLQLPDPETSKQWVPSFLLREPFFTDATMNPKAIIGEAISNGMAIHIPTNYSAQVSGRQVDSTTQEFTITYGTGADEDQIITAMYTAHATQYIPQTQYIKNVLIWKTIFMNGMMLSLILPFIICKRRMAKKNKTPEPAA